MKSRATPPPAESGTDEVVLVRRAKDGDADAFDQLVIRHQNRVFQLCLWVVGDPDEAADAAQDAFIRAFRFLPKFREEASFGTWIGRIALNVARDAAKRRKRRPAPFSAILADDETFDPPADVPSTEDDLLRRERQMVVRRALAALPEHHRIIVVLFDMQGASYEDAARILGLPMGTIKSRLNRARAALKAALSAHRELFEGESASRS